MIYTSRILGSVFPVNVCCPFGHCILVQDCLTNGGSVFRDELKRHYNLGEFWIEVEMEDLASFDEDLADYLYKQPTDHLHLVSYVFSNTFLGR